MIKSSFSTYIGISSLYICVCIYVCICMCVCVCVCVYIYECICVCVYVYMDGWMDRWIITVDSLPIWGPDPGTPPTNRGGHHSAHMHMADPTRTHCKQGLTGYKQPGMYKPSMLNQPAGQGQTGRNKPHPSPKESSLQEETPKHMAFLYAKVHKQMNH